MGEPPSNPIYPQIESNTTVETAAASVIISNKKRKHSFDFDIPFEVSYYIGPNQSLIKCINKNEDSYLSLDNSNFKECLLEF